MILLIIGTGFGLSKRRNPIKKSMYNSFNMGKNWFYNIYVIVTLNGEDANLPEAVQRLRLTETISPLNRYLDEKLRFAEFFDPRI
ncbi:MAG: hypothetical protein HC831_24215 [Chloroflexia bacterium]|nr:hypothetical protein [Chloroflexia bacterium]